MIDINSAKLNLSSNGFLNIDIDIKLDLFEEINKLKKIKMQLFLLIIIKMQIFKI